MRLCDEIVDELDGPVCVLLHSTRNAVLAAANPANRSQLLGSVLETGRDMAMVPGRLCTVTKMLDLARLWATCDDFGVQVTAASAVLYYSRQKDCITYFFFFFESISILHT